MPSVWFTTDFHLGHKNIIRSGIVIVFLTPSKR